MKSWIFYLLLWPSQIRGLKRKRWLLDTISTTKVVIRNDIQFIEYYLRINYQSQVMAKCDHISWLELVEGEAGPLLAYGSRMSQVIGELSKPSAQFPQIVFFMGRQLKNRALRQLCGNG